MSMCSTYRVRADVVKLPGQGNSEDQLRRLGRYQYATLSGDYFCHVFPPDLIHESASCRMCSGRRILDDAYIPCGDVVSAYLCMAGWRGRGLSFQDSQAPNQSLVESAAIFQHHCSSRNREMAFLNPYYWRLTINSVAMLAL